jgi:hypothetical protein
MTQINFFVTQTVGLRFIGGLEQHAKLTVCVTPKAGEQHEKAIRTA